MSPREKVRIQACVDIAAHRISCLLLKQNHRRDDFFEEVSPNNSSGSELLEATLQKVRDSFQEKKVKHFGILYANLGFTEDVSAATGHLLLNSLERLTYRQLCLLAIIGEHGTLDVEALRRPIHTEPELDALKREEMELHSSDIGTFGLVSGGLWTDELSALGQALFTLAGLDEVCPDDKSALLLKLLTIRSIVPSGMQE